MSRRRLFPVLLVGLLLIAVPGHAREEILEFDSTIHVQENGSVRVTETIRVRAEGGEIKRGIYRDFPTEYEDRMGHDYRVEFSVLAVQRNGRPEPHFTRNRSNGRRLYVGREDHFIDPGTHTYTIDYAVSRAVGFFEDHDELYWNVTGHDWSFPIQRVSTTVHLPGPAEPDTIRTSAYTGPRGARGDAYRYTRREAGTVRLETTDPLAPGEGFTVAVGWPKGLVEEPTSFQRLAFFARDNAGLIVGLLGFAVVLMYYLVSWVYVGIDPEKGVIVPRYDPPDGLSPAAARYVMEMGFDDRAFTAAIINMAVKGYLTLEEDGGDYTLRRTGESDDPLSSGETRAAAELFRSGDVVEVDSDNHETLREAMDELEEDLEDGYHRTFFFTNTSWVVVGGLVSLLFLAGVLFASSMKVMGLFGFMALWLSFWTVGVVALLRKAYTQWRRFFTRHKGRQLLGALFTSAFAIPFVAGEFVGVGLLLTTGEYSLMVLFLMYLGLNGLFYVLLKAPTVQGRRLMDRILGFKRYLSVAEKHRLQLENPPDRTPELFERYLPYALALGVENAWTESFSDRLSTVDETGGTHYRPGWYAGSYEGPSDLSSTLSDSLAPTLASSSTAPGSSSGVGGGGFSGGGAGGGGGGGW